MRIGVWVGGIRCFSAPQPRSASLPRRLRCHCSSAPLPTFPRPGARSRPFDPAAVRICCSFATSCGSLCGCSCSQGKGWRQKGGARPWWASPRDHRDRDDGGQDADQGGAEQHQRNFCGSGTDLHATEPSGNMWLDLTGAHRHHPLDHLVHLVVRLEQVDFGDATGMEALTAEDRWLLPPLCFFQLHCQLVIGLISSRHVVRKCV